MAWQLISVALLTLVVAAIFAGPLLNLELWIVKKFSDMTAKPRWWSVWALISVLWITGRHYLKSQGLLSDDADLVLMTVLWSQGPAMVEYALKYTAAEQMAHLTQILLSVQESQQSTEDLAVSIRDVVDRMEDRDKTTEARDRAMFEMVRRIVESLKLDEEVN